MADIKYLLFSMNSFIFIQISLTFVPKGPTDNKRALVELMA